MLDATKIGLATKIVQALATGSRQLTVPVGLGTYYTPAAGTHFYATLKREHRREIVQVTSVTGDTVLITRAADNTSAQEWPAGTCLEVEWNPQQLREFIQAVTTGTEPTGVSPGVYCLDCTTCITVNAAGQITNVDGAERC